MFRVRAERRFMRKQYSRKYHRDCRVIRLKKNPKREREVEFNQFANFYVTPKGRAVHMLNNARARARKYGAAFDLTQGWIEEKLKPGICSVTKLPLVFTMNGGKGHRDNPFSPSLDRIKQTGGYTKRNTRIVCWIYNRSRGAFSDEAFQQMLDALIEQRIIARAA